MDIKSLGYRTDLIFPRFDGIIKERPHYAVIETPSNPGFHWGNFILFKDAPSKGSFETWNKVFTEEFAHLKSISHIAFGWDTSDGNMGENDEFTKAGFVPSESVVLTAKAVREPQRFHSELVVRPIETDLEWEAATENQIQCRDAIFSYDNYRNFKVAQMARYRKMSQSGLGHWFGGFLNGELVASLGIFQDGQLGRFQNVGTNPLHRRKGFCATLVYLSAQYAYERMQIDHLVMVSDDDGDARRVYESVGFIPTEKQCGLSWWSNSK